MAEPIRKISAVVAAGIHCNGKYVREGGNVAFSAREMSVSKHADIQEEAGMKMDPEDINSGKLTVDAGQYFFVPPALLYLSGYGFDYPGHPRVPKAGDDEAAKARTREIILQEMEALQVDFDAS